MTVLCDCDCKLYADIQCEETKTKKLGQDSRTRTNEKLNS